MPLINERIDDEREKRDRIRAAVKKWQKETRERRAADKKGPAKKARARLDELRWKLERSVRRIKRLVAKQPKLGKGPWGGSQSFFEAIVIPILDKHGVPVTSTKRWETYGNPDSDHYNGNTTAYAVDGGIGEAYWLRDECARAVLGRAVSDYELAYFTAPNGVQFRYQAIAATHGTGPHLHQGIRRV